MCPSLINTLAIRNNAMTDCLVVDDSRTIRKVITGILSKMNIQHREADSGLTAYEQCQRAMPAFILLDWQMPGMDGLEFLKKLRQEPDGGSPKVIFCTTESGIENIDKAIRAGADEYIMKPFDQDILTSKLSMIGAL